MFPQILKGVRVIDFSRLLPGPFASRLLAQLGAEVTCILPPVGDPILGNYSPFPRLSIGRKFKTVNLKDAKELGEVQCMIAGSSILLEGFRPGTMDRLGLGFDEVCKIKPDIIYASIVGYTEAHPKFLSGAHDINFLVDSGVYSLLFPDNSTELPALQLADVLGGFYAAFQILLRWIAHLQDLKPQYVRVSIVEGLELLVDYLKDPSTFDFLPMTTGQMARYRIYKTKDDRRVAVAGIEANFYKNLLEVFDIKNVLEMSEEAVIDRLTQEFASRNLEELKITFANTDACISFIPSRQEVLTGVI